MAKLILLCPRDGKPLDSFSRKIEALSRRLIPDNITPNPPLLMERNGISIGVLNPTSDLPLENSGICLGNLIQPRDDWWKPGADFPDGTYALFRHDLDSIELVSDALATRTIWYAHTKDLFVASTSQRAIIFFLQEFKPNREVYPWMLSSGTIGPGLSWDSRIECLTGNARLQLDRRSWKTTLHHEPVRFTPSGLPPDRLENQLRETIEDIFDHLHLNDSKWLLSLSGGIDSRALLLFLKDRARLDCITWGTKASLEVKNSDASIARNLAELYGLEHRFFEIGFSDVPIERVVSRFLTAGEGRSDNIAGYMDGFKIWKYIFESGYSGILRGDQAFGNRPVSRPRHVYNNVRLLILSDYDNLDSLEGVIADFGQKRPSSLSKKEKESLESWRDRLNAEFEIPVVFAALNDLKLPYVEIIDPFLSRRIVQKVRQLPDRLRTDKNLFRKMVGRLDPGIPFAGFRAVPALKKCLNTRSMVDFIVQELNTDRARSLLPDELIRFILRNVRASEPEKEAVHSRFYGFLRKITPKSVRRYKKRKFQTRHLDLNTLGFRACLISKMDELLSDDARTLLAER